MLKRTHGGFTLIEVVITVLIVSILASVALPAYTKHVTKTRRAAAEACLMIYANYMERNYATTMRYDQTSAGTALTSLPAEDCASSANTGPYYTYGISASDQSTYTLVATPQGTQASNDAVCKNLTIDQTGSRNKTGTGAVTDCWAH